MTLFIKHQLLHHVQSIANRNILSSTQVKFIIIQPSLRRFLGQYQASIMNHQFFFPVVNFLSFFSLCFLVHSIIICIYISFFCISADLSFCSHSLFLFGCLFIQSSFFVHMLYRLHGLFETIWCFLIALPPYMRRISMYHTLLSHILFLHQSRVFSI